MEYLGRRALVRVAAVRSRHVGLAGPAGPARGEVIYGVCTRKVPTVPRYLHARCTSSQLADPAKQDPDPILRSPPGQVSLRPPALTASLPAN